MDQKQNIVSKKPLSSQSLIALVIAIIIESFAALEAFRAGNPPPMDIAPGIIVFGIIAVISLIASLAFYTFLSIRKTKLACLFAPIIFIGLVILNSLISQLGTNYYHLTNRVALRNAEAEASKALTITEKESSQAFAPIDFGKDIITFEIADKNQTTRKSFYYNRQNQTFEEISDLGSNFIAAPNKKRFASQNTDEEGQRTVNVYEVGKTTHSQISKINDNISYFSAMTFSQDSNYLIARLSGTTKPLNWLSDSYPNEKIQKVDGEIGYSVFNLESGTGEFFSTREEQQLVEKYWPNATDCKLSDISQQYENQIGTELSNCNSPTKDKSEKKIVQFTKYNGKNYQIGVRTDISHLYDDHASGDWYYEVMQSGGNADDPEAIFRVSKDNKNLVMVLNTYEKLGYGKTNFLLVMSNNDIIFSYSNKDLDSKLYVFNEKTGLKEIQNQFAASEPKVVWQPSPTEEDKKVVSVETQPITTGENDIYIQSPYDAGP